MSKSDYFKMFPESICSALRDLVSFEQFKNREKHPWRSVNFNLTKISTPPWVFSSLLNCAHGTKSHKTSHLSNQRRQKSVKATVFKGLS